ncbi:MAG TPA: hypothetical protein VGJ05_02270, partial [Fimbriiglobus sp.]
WLYRRVLGYFLWMSRLSLQTRWVIILGLLVIQQIVASISRTHPDLRPFLEPLLIAYVAFALTTWTAAPLSNLFLRLNRYGRFALSRDQRRASNWVGGFVLLALGGVGWGFFAPAAYAWLGWPVALSFIILLMPVAATFACPVGWPRKWMTVYTVGMVGLVATAVTLIVSAICLDKTDGKTAVENVDLGLELVRANTWAGLGSSFLANWLMSVRPRL